MQKITLARLCHLNYTMKIHLKYVITNVNNSAIVLPLREKKSFLINEVIISSTKLLLI